VSAYAKDVLVETAWVAEHLHDPGVRIVEVDENPSLYAEAHIPGAIGLDWSTLQARLCADPGTDALPALLGSKGISDDHTVVLYGDRNNWFAASAYWHLTYLGHHGVKLMNGPRDKWIAEGRPLSHDLPSHPPATFTLGETDESIRARREELGEADGTRRVLLDVRSPHEFADEAYAGAASVPWAQAVQVDGSFRPREELECLYGAQGVLGREGVIAYCRAGERSAHTWFVLHELLGVATAKNFDGCLEGVVSSAA
jgi:thiosulfate/3-mercaptopyruvate sulfurtransferase